MKYLKFLLIGFIFGITLVKSEAISWYRIQEMFRFQSFHMYGIFISAILVGVTTVFLINRFQLKSINNEEIKLKGKPFNKVSNIVGGISFGLGWALTGCCVAPLFVLAGYGLMPAVVMLISAVVGVFVYGQLKPRLPH